jgi:hypothetical protein
MRWFWIGFSAFLIIEGFVYLLYGYRILGKSPGTEAWDNAEIATSWTRVYKQIGWSSIVLGAIGFIGSLIELLS